MTDLATLSIDVEPAPCPRCSNKLRRRVMQAVYALLAANAVAYLVLDATVLLERGCAETEASSLGRGGLS